MYDIIKRKRDGGELSDEEISFFIDGYVSGEIPDYQASALVVCRLLVSLPCPPGRAGHHLESATSYTIGITLPS